MNKASSRVASLRHICEILFSLNVALVAKLQGNQRPNRFFSTLEAGQLNLQLVINRNLHIIPHSSVGGYLAFYAYALLWTLVLYIMIRYFSQTRLATALDQPLEGIISLVGLPVSWLYVGTAPTLPNPPHSLLILELIFVTVCALLYSFSKLSLPIWGTVLMLAFHFALWGWLLLGGPYFWFSPLRTVVAVAGFTASLAWAVFVRAKAQTADVTPLPGSSPTNLSQVPKVQSEHN